MSLRVPSHEHVPVLTPDLEWVCDVCDLAAETDAAGDPVWPDRLTDAHRELLAFITSAHVERNPLLLTRIAHHQVHLLNEEQVRAVLRAVQV